MSLDLTSDTRKPVVALMGEFSAGKTTLANLLIGDRHLPVQVIATRLPPVWICYGDGPGHRVDLDGVSHPVDLQRLDLVPLEDTLYIRIYSQQDILEQCDLIDMPGISDPNMAADVWQRVIPNADIVLWCTHATQAWRQSEAAVWASMPRALYDKSLLLLTRADKLTSARDRARVIKRIRRETRGLFADVLAISLLEATQNQQDYDTWSKSGAEDFARRLVEMLHAVAPGTVALPEVPDVPVAPPLPVACVDETKVSPRRVVARTKSRAPERRASVSAFGS
ncbi:MAG: dynamin family protein [Sedimentitalea sp.]